MCMIRSRDVHNMRSCSARYQSCYKLRSRKSGVPCTTTHHAVEKVTCMYGVACVVHIQIVHVLLVYDATHTLQDDTGVSGHPDIANCAIKSQLTPSVFSTSTW